MIRSIDPEQPSAGKKFEPSSPLSAIEPVGEIIRKARESRRLSIESIAKTLKLKANYIEAIEANKYDLLPGDVYIRVYLRSLSHFLSLDPEKILEGFFHERGVHGVDTLRKDHSTKINLTVVKEKEKPKTIVIVVIALIALIAAFSFILSRKDWHDSQTKQAQKSSMTATPNAASPAPTATKTDNKRNNAHPPVVVQTDKAASPESGSIASAAPTDTVLAEKTKTTPITPPSPPTLTSAPALTKPDDTAQTIKSFAEKSVAAHTKDTAKHSAATPALSADSASKAKIPAAKPATAHKDTIDRTPAALPKKNKDSTQTTTHSTIQPTSIFLADTGWKFPSNLMSPKDSARKANVAPLHHKDSVRQTPPAKSPRVTDSLKTGLSVQGTAGQTAYTVPPASGKTMRLRMTVLSDSAWARVFSDGTQWRNTVRRGRGVTFSARDSFNVHVGRNEAVAFTLDGKPLTIPGTGVMAFRIDKSGMIRWTIDKWNDVFRNRY